MGHRLTKIYTRKGDDGTTGLADGARLAKDSPRMELIGDVDELNSFIGLVLTKPLFEALTDDLIQCQHVLFNLGGEIAMPGFSLVDTCEIDKLEVRLDVYNEKLSPLKEFILPGGCDAAAYAHLARSVCRRAERRMITLNKTLDEPYTISQKYLNRLSDFLFVISRSINKHHGIADVCWNNKFSKTAKARSDTE